MIKNLFINTVEESCIPHIQDSFSKVSRANTLTEKVNKLVKLIILFPWLAVKDLTYSLKRCFVKKNSNLKTSQSFIAKHSSATLKGALVGGVCLGGIKLRGLMSAKVPNQWSMSYFLESFSKLSVGSRISILVAGLFGISLGIIAVKNQIDTMKWNGIERKFNLLLEKLQKNGKFFESAKTVEELNEIKKQFETTELIKKAETLYPNSCQIVLNRASNYRRFSILASLKSHNLELGRQYDKKKGELTQVKTTNGEGSNS